MTLNVIYRLQAFSNAIRRTFVQYFTRFQFSTDSVLARFLCTSRASCLVLVIFAKVISYITERIHFIHTFT